MRISVFGIGYVGAVTAACLADDGHDVVAVDRLPGKVALLAAGKAPIVEPGLAAMLANAVDRGRLHATGSAAEAVSCTDLSLVCVGTPSLPNGGVDPSHVADVTAEIAEALAGKESFHGLAYRSTMLPGSMARIVRRTLGKKLSADRLSEIGLAYFPEFLREGSAIADSRLPGLMIAGTDDPRVALQLQELTAGLDCPRIITDIPTAEAVKYASNSWHALKIGFANEIGNFCSAAGVDGHRVMDAVCADRRLNISSAYMRPGMAFGGSCLPKDLRAIRQRATSLDVATPILDAVYSSNRQQIDRAVDLIARQGRRKVSMLGLSFKPGTDDLRESPLVEIAERLYGKGHDLRIFDRSVHNATLNGSNLSFIQDRLPHLADVLDADLTRVLAHGDVLVVGHALAEFSEAVRGLNPAKKVVDLVRLTPVAGRDSSNYVGLCWHA